MGKVAKRKLVRSPLAAWLDAQGMTMREFGRRIGIPHNRLSGVIDGRATPGIVVAYEIERLTNGEVSMESWLGLAIARTAMTRLRMEQPPEFQSKDFRESEEEKDGLEDDDDAG